MDRLGRNLILFTTKAPRQFGGMLLKGNAKTARPISTKQPIHLVLKSKHAVGAQSLLNRRNSAHIESIIRKHAGNNGIRIYHLVNVGNHLHMVLRVQQPNLRAGQQAFASFLRSITGLIARHVLRAERGAAQGVKFWQARPFTRVASWGRDFRALSAYMTKNFKQARRIVDWGFSVTDAARIAHLESG